MSESESELITMTVTIKQAENPDLFARLLPIHNRRTRGSVLRNLASLGMVVTKSGLQIEQLVSSKQIETTTKLAVSSTKPTSGIVDRTKPSPTNDEDLKPTSYKLPVEY